MTNFAEALSVMLRNIDCGIPSQIRRASWGTTIWIGLQKPDEHSYMTAPYLYLESLKGRIPWIPSMMEICVADDWEVIV